MPTGLRRIYGKGHWHFITFSCYRRLAFLKSARARDVFVQELGKLRAELGFHLLGYVVMPEHVHLLISEPPRAHLPRWLRKRKKCACAGQMELPFGKLAEPFRSFWQERFYDFNVYSQGKKLEKLNYMHANPVKRKLVGHPRDWRWSSWSFYHGNGGLVIDAE